MSDETKQRTPAVGVDVGTSRIVVASKQGDEYRFESQLNAFVSVPYSPMTEKALERDGIPFSRTNGRLSVHGDESIRFADLLGLEVRRPMMSGMLNPEEPESIEVIGALLDAVLGKEPGGGRPLYFSVPADPAGDEAAVTYHEATLKDLLASRGYEVHSINEGLAVIYSELEDSNYSGVGVSFGGGLCNVCVAYLSVPVLSFSVSKAGDYIDASVAAVTGERATRVRLEKEASFYFNGRSSDKVLQALGVYYDDMIQAVVEGFGRRLEEAGSLLRFKRELPMVLSGGTALPEGFAERFEQAMRAAELPLPVSEVRLAKNPLEATAKGALVAALAAV